MNIAAFFPALIGGALIGVSASLLWLSHGRVAGISGILSRTLERGLSLSGLRSSSDFWFLVGLSCGGIVLALTAADVFGEAPAWPAPLLLLAGLCVGFGARWGGGCTSGHGVCGVSRFSLRSILAVCVFILSGALSLGLCRHWLGAP